MAEQAANRGGGNVKNKYSDKPFSHPAIADLVVEAWFGKRKSLGMVEYETLKTIPLPMIALATTCVTIPFASIL